MIKFVRKTLIALISFAILIVTGCVTAPVKYENRDTSGYYDGEWIGIVKGTEKYQRGNNYEYFCDPFFEGQLNFHVSQGSVNGFFEQYRDSEFQAYINADGFFRVIIKSNYTWSGEAGSIAPMRKAVVIEGNLAKEGVNGVFVIALDIDGMNGCRTDVKYFKL